MDTSELYGATEQMLRLIEQIERATGLTLYMDRLGETVAYTAKAAKLWDEILDLARAEPAPLTFFDMLIHMTPMVVLRGTPEAVEYYAMLKSEVEDRIAKGIAAVPGETQRFYWDGPPIWSALRPLSRIFADRGRRDRGVDVLRDVHAARDSTHATRSRASRGRTPPCSAIARSDYQRDYLARQVRAVWRGRGRVPRLPHHAGGQSRALRTGGPGRAADRRPGVRDRGRFARRTAVFG